MSETVRLSTQTIHWVELAIQGYDPLTASIAENTPEKLACWAIHNLLQRDPYDRLAETLEKFHDPTPTTQQQRANRAAAAARRARRKEEMLVRDEREAEHQVTARPEVRHAHRAVMTPDPTPTTSAFLIPDSETAATAREGGEG